MPLSGSGRVHVGVVVLAAAAAMFARVRIGAASDCNTNGVDDAEEIAPILESYIDAPNLNFPDLVETTDTIMVSAGTNGEVADLNVGLIITHPFMGDTSYWLTSPGDVTVDLMSFLGASSDNADILFDDQAASAPPEGGMLVGTFQPAEPLAAMVEAPRAGDWTIHCLDTFSGAGTGVLNQWSLYFTVAAAPDCNSNGVPDVCDSAGGTSPDCNTNAIPDACEPPEQDCDANGIPDVCDLASGSAVDCNSNQLADSCEDCNANGVADVCDVAMGQSPDCNTNIIPDECEPADRDCNSNGIPDTCDLAYASSEDCNSNELPDECEDCNSNGIADVCDMMETTTEIGAFSRQPEALLTGLYETTDTLTVSGDGVFDDVNVQVMFDHQAIWTVFLWLDKDGETFVDLMGARGYGSSSADVLFDDEAPNGVPNSGPVVGTFKPFEPLGQFNIDGRQAGDWTLHCIDTAEDADGGVLHAWSISFGQTSAASRDCNLNSVPDECDVGAGSSLDCDTNGVPDECESDCDSSGLLDLCELFTGTAQDCDSNAVPDVCEPDCDTNGVQDACEIAEGLAADCDTNSIPDLCDLGYAVTLADSPNMPIDSAVPDYTPPILIVSDGLVSDVNVCVDITHPFERDVELSLVKDATSVLLVEETGGAGGGFNGTCFDDEAQTSIQSGSPPFTGTFRPLLPLSAFDGQPAGGQWRLRFLKHHTYYDDGVLHDWMLSVTIASGQDCNTTGIPDACEPGALPDCNTNGFFDACELPSGTSSELDCNTNGVLDECDAAGETSSDCNTNAVVDECDWGCDGFWDNGPPDGVNGWANVDGSIVICADDFEVSKPTIIAGATFSDVEDTTFLWNGRVRVSVWSQIEGSSPAQPDHTQLVSDEDGSVTRVQGGALFGRPQWDYTVRTNVEVSQPGVNWVSLAPQQAGGSGFAYWLTSATPANFGTSYLGFCHYICVWIPLDDVDGNPVDLAFSLALGECEDCNTNGQLDLCDMADGGSPDCGSNQVPDACESDCNTNGLPDPCEDDDCNANGTLDLCEIAAGSAPDSDGDGLLDECELAPCNTCPGDVVADGSADADDIAGFVACLFSLPPEPGCGCGDMDGDQDIDADDTMLLIDKLLNDADIACP